MGWRKSKDEKVVELLPRPDPQGQAESIPLRLDAVREELDRLRAVIDNRHGTEASAREAGKGLHFIARRLLDALSGVDP